jgi:hypothetical protein
MTMYNQSSPESKREEFAEMAWRVSVAANATNRTRALIFTQYPDIEQPEVPAYKPESDASLSLNSAQVAYVQQVAGTIVNETARQGDQEQVDQEQRLEAARGATDNAFVEKKGPDTHEFSLPNSV